MAEPLPTAHHTNSPTPRPDVPNDNSPAGRWKSAMEISIVSGVILLVLASVIFIIGIVQAVPEGTYEPWDLAMLGLYLTPTMVPATGAVVCFISAYAFRTVALNSENE